MPADSTRTVLTAVFVFLSLRSPFLAQGECTKNQTRKRESEYPQGKESCKIILSSKKAGSAYAISPADDKDGLLEAMGFFKKKHVLYIINIY